MPILVLPAKYEVNRAVTQSAYEWVLTEQAHQSGNDPTTRYFDVFFSSVIVPQLEMFSCGTEVDQYYVFKNLVKQWRLQRGTTSSTTEMVLSPAYQSIIGMGPAAIRLILAQLASEGNDPDHWFWALQVLTKANPVSESDEGNLRSMARAWLDWAASEGYAW